jgi:hypothetical protein
MRLGPFYPFLCLYFLVNFDTYTASSFSARDVCTVERRVEQSAALDLNNVPPASTYTMESGMSHGKSWRR